ncbi:RNA polymerase sigma-70 factor [Olivibacter domesticus]|uniref:RNA polymerase sigma-70 factor, ECF subfamily n=1 Tax=Olivibacter domesticus TaxID=407022 RepID=A0A1H7TCA2_OLID1|nr:RNA polymerase sigma-70 factor [Olivibacter domesticus]SEL82492.1 RNA polymerase sigma-70 factor, ECF subfamily [Olivibacter domesticus]
MDDQSTNRLAQENTIKWDVASFEKIYRQYWHALTLYCTSYLDNEVLAEEIVQEVFLNIWRRKEEIHLTYAKLKNYLIRAVKFKIFDYFRAQAIKQKHEDCLCQQNCNQNPQDTDQIILYRELSGTLRILINELPCKCREVYLLHEAGIEVIEIAEKLQISIHTVKYHLQYAQKFLRQELKSTTYL